MASTADIPTLRIIRTDLLIPHEQHDAQRSRPLVERLRQEGMLKNPPVVAPLGEGDPRCVVLDGANRATALAAMGVRHSLVQVVNYENPEEVSLATWNHVVTQVAHDEFLTLLTGIKGIELAPSDLLHARASLARREALACVVLADGAVFRVHGGRDLRSRCQLLNALVDVYKDRARLLRTTGDQVEEARTLYANLTALVLFPHHEPVEIIVLARDGERLPAGITRHIIARRALRLNYPLSELSAEYSIEEKNQRLQEWVRTKLAEKKIRYYPESTYLFDE